MSIKKYSDDCPGCRPAILNLKTGKAEADDSPLMQAMNQVWEQTTQAERFAYHRVCCLNSRKPRDMKLAQGIVARFQKVAESQ